MMAMLLPVMAVVRLAWWKTVQSAIVQAVVLWALLAVLVDNVRIWAPMQVLVWLLVVAMGTLKRVKAVMMVIPLLKMVVTPAV